MPLSHLKANIAEMLLANQEHMTKLNRDICQQIDCLPKLTKLFKEALNEGEKVTHPPISNIEQPAIFQAAFIPFDRLCYIFLAQVLSLDITEATGESSLRELSDSTFLFEGIGNGIYQIRRKNKMIGLRTNFANFI